MAPANPRPRVDTSGILVTAVLTFVSVLLVSGLRAAFVMQELRVGPGQWTTYRAVVEALTPIVPAVVAAVAYHFGYLRGARAARVA